MTSGRGKVGVIAPEHIADGIQAPNFLRPYDWEAIDRSVLHGSGAAVLRGFLAADRVAACNREIDAYLERHPTLGAPATGSGQYDAFLGHRTVRMHGLVEKTPLTGALIGDTEIVGWAQRVMANIANSVLLNAGELIQIGPGERLQPLHRDSETWPVQPFVDAPLVVNAIFALDAFTLENGATRIAPGSWSWNRDREACPADLARVVMDAGDVLLFRGDVLHGGGDNRTQAPRRAVSNSYCAGWLRPVENSFLNLRRETVSKVPPLLQGVLGYRAHMGAGPCGLYENSDPAAALKVSE